MLIMNAHAIHETYKSSTLIQSFNHLGQCIGYDKVRRYHTDMATLTAEKNDVPIPSHFDTETLPTTVFFYHKEATLSRIGGSHDTVSSIILG